MTDLPNLGLATTTQLLDELEARFVVDGDHWLAEKVRDVRVSASREQLDYRTASPAEGDDE